MLPGHWPSVTSQGGSVLGGKGCGRSCKLPMTARTEVAGGGLDWNLPRCKCLRRSDSALRFSSLLRQQIWLPKSFRAAGRQGYAGSRTRGHPCLPVPPSP